MKDKMNQAADFEVSSNTGSRLTMWVAMLGLLLLTAWAGLTEIDQVKRAQGQIIASDRTQGIQAVVLQGLG